MDIFKAMEEHGHEQLVFCYDKVTGVKMIVGIHDTTLGPALGGCRVWNYPSEEAAIEDVLRLSEGMTYKNSAMGLSLGGGKTVVWADSHTLEREPFFRAVGRFVQSLGGRYITAEDVGTSVGDMEIVAEETAFVRGLKETSGDPSTMTALGVFVGIKACLHESFGSDSVSGRHVALQGFGHVGRLLAERLKEEGARLTVADVDEENARHAREAFGAETVDPDAIYDVAADVFSPCALGAVINDDTIPRLKVKVVAGSANNQLKSKAHGQALAQRGILYAPDYVINGGGVINVADEGGIGGYHPARVEARVEGIYAQLLKIFAISREQQITPHEAAEHLALERIARIAAGKTMYLRR